MQKMKKLLVALVILSALVAGICGIMIVLGAGTDAVMAAATKTLQLFGIVGLVAGVIIAVLELAKD